MARLANLCASAAVVIVSGISTLGFGTGCAPADDAERFREALPAQEEVALRVPGGGTTTTRSQGLRIATGDTVTANARYYQFTRDLTTAVDFGSAVILGGIWALVHTPPTTLEDKRAVWGPGSGNALEPAIWKFTVTEVGDAEYDYALEGQLKSGGPWLSVLTGHGFGKSRAEHRQGWFQWNNDTYRTLEPTRAKDDGSTKVTFDLRKLPATLAVELRPAAEKGWMDVLVTHDTGGAGSVTIKGLGDIDDSKKTKLEDVNLVSRWASDGSGRSDIILENGDLPFAVDATECWSTSFARVYYQDKVNFEPTVGDPSKCTFEAAKF